MPQLFDLKDTMLGSALSQTQFLLAGLLRSKSGVISGFLRPKHTNSSPNTASDANAIRPPRTRHPLTVRPGRLQRPV